MREWKSAELFGHGAEVDAIGNQRSDDSLTIRYYLVNIQSTKSSPTRSNYHFSHRELSNNYTICTCVRTTYFVFRLFVSLF